MRFLLSIICLLAGICLFGQSFSEEKNTFRQQAINKLRSLGTEPAKKIAFDFQNAWDGKLTAEQQNLAHTIALKMQRKGYEFYPYYYHFFSYLAYSVAQADLDKSKLDNVLKINSQVVGYLNKEEYGDFLFGLNLFFARRYLSYDKNLYVQAPEGSYSFELLDEVIEEDPLAKFMVEEEPVVNDTASFLTDEQIAEQYSSTTTDDDNWGSDSWGNDDWGNNDDSWGNNDDWGSTDSWGSNDDWGNDTDDWSSAPEETFNQSVVEAPPEKPSFSPLVIDHLKTIQNKYIHPIKDGPVTNLVNTLILMTTPYDSVKIKGVNGSYLLKNRGLVAENGTVEWPAQNKNFVGANVQLGQFHIKKDRSDFWTPNATLNYPRLSDSEVPGIFEFKSTPRRQNSINSYPIFTSNEADITVKLTENAIYTGGIQLKGNELYGHSASKKPGTLKLLDGSGNSVVIKASYFNFQDSVASTNIGRVTIFHGTDSIFHKSVRAKYDLRTQELRILRNSNIAPFQSTFFGLTMGVDLITWDMKGDSINMEIMNAKDLLPATFESKEYFDQVKFAKLGRFLHFNPITLIVNYTRKYNTTELYAGELALEYNIHESYAKAAGKLFYDYGFGEYNAETGLIKVYPTAYHYYDASSKKVDFDNLMVPSKIKTGHNAIFSLDSGAMYVKGVSRFYITSDFEVYAEPYDSTVTILENRSLKWKGSVHAGDFEYQGTHEFDYSEFLINMPQIDSVQLVASLLDTASLDSSIVTRKLDNQITSTEGTLYIDQPGNKSGKIEYGEYPLFSTSTDAIIYFDGPEILGGAYDRSVRFFVPPFEIDSVEQSEVSGTNFHGTFNSGGIFPTFEETLSVQLDGSLGFRHLIPNEGYHLYGTEAKTYEAITLSNKGLRGYGKIDFLTTTLYSDDFIYFPDSVIASGTNGVISPGTVENASFPEAVLGNYKMYWLPRKDSMYLRTVYQPFEFYNSTAKLTGEANITTKGVFGSGVMLTRGSKALSRKMTFEEFSYSARHARFEVLTSDMSKPAMFGEDIRLDFDLKTNTALVRPERSGVAAISFPYSQMKTSVTEAVWDLEDSTVTMIKRPEVPLSESYFFSTKKELDSLAFNADKAVYDINSQELKIEGIPYIQVADARIIPKNQQTVILANSELQKFEDAEIIIDTLNGYHYLKRASITIISRNKFEGSAWYQQIVGKDTFDIRFDSFELQEVPIDDESKKGKKETQLMTVSGGELTEKMNFVVAPGFQYKGSVTMFARKEALELEGAIRLTLDRQNEWIVYSRKDGANNITIDFDEAVFESGQKAIAGMHYGINGKIYTTIAENKSNDIDTDFFLAQGLLTFLGKESYKIETAEKSSGKSYEGTTMIYQDSAQSVFFEGPVNFTDPNSEQITVRSSANGFGDESGEIKADAMLLIDLNHSAINALTEVMANDLIEVIERTGPPTANNIQLESLNKVANLIGDKATKAFEETFKREYIPLVTASRELVMPFAISGVKLNWSDKTKSWHNSTKLGVSNIGRNDINAKLDGFIEFKKDDVGEDVMNLFIQAAPGSWYYFGYSSNELVAYSSNPKFNKIISSKTNIDKAKPGELVLVEGDENETLSFINNFREQYFGITEPYNLVFPDDISTEEDEFDTIEEDEDDDGFGF